MVLVRFHSTWQTRHPACISGTLCGSHNTRRLRECHVVAGSNSPSNSHYVKEHYHAIHASKNKDWCETSSHLTGKKRAGSLCFFFTIDISVADNIVLSFLFFWIIFQRYRENIELINFYCINVFSFFQVLFCSLTDEQKKLYKSYLCSDDVSFILHERNNHHDSRRYRARFLIALSALRKMCNHPDLFLYTREQVRL